MWMIVISLFWIDPSDSTDKYFKISHLDGKPLTFESQKECFDHIDENAPDLKKYVESFYKSKATVGEYLCVIY